MNIGAVLVVTKPLVYGVAENKGGRLDHLGNPPDMSKYLKQFFACGADFRRVKAVGGGGS